MILSQVKHQAVRNRQVTTTCVQGFTVCTAGFYEHGRMSPSQQPCELSAPLYQWVSKTKQRIFDLPKVTQLSRVEPRLNSRSHVLPSTPLCAQIGVRLPYLIPIPYRNCPKLVFVQLSSLSYCFISQNN